MTGTGGGVQQQMIGTWKLIEQTGALIDICPDETIDFQSNGIAILTCPNSGSISRNYSVENSILTYTQTSVSYAIQTLTSDSLYLTGENVSRNLRYFKIIANNTDKINYESAGRNNSSEARR